LVKDINNAQKEDFAMELTIPVYAKTIRDALTARRSAAGPLTRGRPLAPPPRAPGLFRRAQPTTFQRCLAVHMHFAQHASALD
jgi:hypothetical protein